MVEEVLPLVVVVARQPSTPAPKVSMIHVIHAIVHANVYVAFRMILHLRSLRRQLQRLVKAVVKMPKKVRLVAGNNRRVEVAGVKSLQRMAQVSCSMQVWIHRVSIGLRCLNGWRRNKNGTVEL